VREALDAVVQELLRDAVDMAVHQVSTLGFQQSLNPSS
jgi:hypothetical protein